MLINNTIPHPGVASGAAASERAPGAAAPGRARRTHSPTPYFSCSVGIHMLLAPPSPDNDRLRSAQQPQPRSPFARRAGAQPVSRRSSSSSSSSRHCPSRAAQQRSRGSGGASIVLIDGARRALWDSRGRPRLLLRPPPSRAQSTLGAVVSLRRHAHLILRQNNRRRVPACFARHGGWGRGQAQSRPPIGPARC